MIVFSFYVVMSYILSSFSVITWSSCSYCCCKRPFLGLQRWAGLGYTDTYSYTLDTSAFTHTHTLDTHTHTNMLGMETHTSWIQGHTHPQQRDIHTHMLDMETHTPSTQGHTRTYWMWRHKPWTQTTHTPLTQGHTHTHRNILNTGIHKHTRHGDTQILETDNTHIHKHPRHRNYTHTRHGDTQTLFTGGHIHKHTLDTGLYTHWIWRHTSWRQGHTDTLLTQGNTHTHLGQRDTDTLDTGTNLERT